MNASKLEVKSVLGITNPSSYSVMMTEKYLGVFRNTEQKNKVRIGEKENVENE